MKSRLIAILLFFLSLLSIACVVDASAAKADYFSFPCSPGGQGSQVDINGFIFNASGQFCDGPTQWGLQHAHCLAGGGVFNGGNIGGIATGGPFGGVLNNIGSRGIGGSGGNCEYECPDGFPAPSPNPPFYGSSAPYVDARKVIKLGVAFCVKEHHLRSAGRTSDIVLPEEGDPDHYVPNKPGESLDDLINQNEAQAHPPEVVPQNPPPNGEVPNND